MFKPSRMFHKASSLLLLLLFIVNAAVSAYATAAGGADLLKTPDLISPPQDHNKGKSQTRVAFPIVLFPQRLVTAAAMPYQPRPGQAVSYSNFTAQEKLSRADKNQETNTNATPRLGFNFLTCFPIFCPLLRFSRFGFFLLHHDSAIHLTNLF